MKTLYLMRHAKSDWSNGSLSDFERPLNHRGENDAPMMAEIFAGSKPAIELIISSPATRAITTAIHIANALDYKPQKIQTERRIYNQGMENILDIIHDVDNSIERVLMIGHNPTFTEAVNYFCNYGLGNMPTAAIFGIAFDVDDWRAVDKNMGRHISYEWPKKHK